MNPQFLTVLSFLSLLLASWSTPTIQIRPGWQFRDELISEMESPKDTIYVEDRRQLIKVSKPHGRGRSVAFSNSELGIMIYLRNSPFNSKKHNLDLEHGMIDGYKAHGILGNRPTTQLTDIKILWDTTVLTIPLRAFTGLYNLWLSNPNADPPEAYVTRDGSLLYIYIAGADGAGSYSVKFVFNRKRYVTRIIGSIECMDQFDYIDGHGNCE